VNSYRINLLLLKDARALVDREMYAKSERMSVVIVFPIDIKRDWITMTSWYLITAGTPFTHLLTFCTCLDRLQACCVNIHFVGTLASCAKSVMRHCLNHCDRFYDVERASNVFWRLL
jgi:hypothetical protein